MTAYCSADDVSSLFGDISDDVSTAMMNTAVENAGAWIDSNLKRAYVPLPELEPEPESDDVVVDDTPVEETLEETETETTEETTTTSTTESTSQHTTTIQYNLINVPNGLKAASIYYAASDILLSLYQGDELPIQYDVWFQKAQTLLDDYIEAYLNADADEADLVAHQMVKHSKGLTYRQKRMTRRRW